MGWEESGSQANVFSPIFLALFVLIYEHAYLFYFKVHVAMKAFHSTYYQPNNLALVVVASQGLDTQQAWVEARFGEIPPSPVRSKESTPSSSPSFTFMETVVDPESAPIAAPSEPSPIFPAWIEEARLPLEVQYAPLRELRRLALIWETPRQRDLWAAPPQRLLSHLLGHEGLGSCFAHLQVENKKASSP